MSVKISDKITVKIETVDKMYDIIKKSGIEEVSFEFIVGSCFPKILENIKNELHRQYTQGYIDGQKEATV